MANKRPVIENPLDDMNITDIVRSITSEAPTASAKPQDDEAGPVAAPKPKAVKRPSKSGRSISKTFSDQLITNYLRYDKSSEKGKPIYVSSDLVERLQAISEKYYKRLSARAITQALLETFFNDFDGEETVDEFMRRIHYVAPSERELAARKVAAEKAREARRNAK
jgi:hypothetical protein